MVLTGVSMFDGLQAAFREVMAHAHGSFGVETGAESRLGWQNVECNLRCKM